MGVGQSKLAVTPKKKTVQVPATSEVVVNVPAAYVSSESLTGTLADYAKLTDLSTYATQAQLADYAKTADLAQYATQTQAQLADYAKTADLAQYATQTQLVDYVTKQEMNNTLMPYATTSQLDQYVTTDALVGKLAPFATLDELTSRLMPLATKSELSSAQGPRHTELRPLTNDFHRFPGRNLPGNDIVSSDVQNVDDCQNLCSNNPRCIMYSYGSADPAAPARCWQKHAGPNVPVVGYAGYKLPSPTGQGNVYSAYHSGDFGGNDLQCSPGIKDAASCRQKCDDNADCTHVTWLSDGVCCTKKYPTVVSSILGVRRQNV